ncbi:hypothetical protein EGW08_016618 [Elysia chlorotica]|uniref:Platelet-derived growth factor (PDGF) family profile domain-containing protein n=1 Tax=Elysia chlorotica TaxID=188477 RepID=A0A3S1AYS5_ELYCH|nr:hypothetical protein EGW08_016618 [Elysia chlorotica]
MVSVTVAVVCFTLLGIVVSQGRVQAWGRQLDSLPGREREAKLSALDRMMNVKNMEEFMSLLTINGRRVTENDMYSPYPSRSKLRISSEGGFVAKADHCSPREMTVDLELPEPNQRMVYFPRCTRLERCGGCDSSGHVSCVPEKTETRVLNVAKAQVPFPESENLLFLGFEKVKVERHMSCRLQCNLSQEKCGKLKLFLPSQCACVCPEIGRCRVPTEWDPQNCRCVCPKNQECPAGQKVNQINCRCEKDFNRQEIAIDVYRSLTSASKSPSLMGNKQQPNSSSSYGQSGSRPSAEEKSQTQTERPSVCPGVNCPPNFYTQKTRHNLCVCVPKVRRGSYYRRRQAILRTQERLRNERRSALEQRGGT